LDDLRVKRGQFLSPSILLSEAAGAIARHTGNADLARKAAAVLKQPEDLCLVEMEANFAQGAAVLADDLGLRGADALCTAVALRLKIPLAAWDACQGQRATSVIEVLEIQM
jgi:predicted nucleic acid-binding protein